MLDFRVLLFAQYSSEHLPFSSFLIDKADFLLPVFVHDQYWLLLELQLVDLQAAHLASGVVAAAELKEDLLVVLVGSLDLPR